MPTVTSLPAMLMELFAAAVAVSRVRIRPKATELTLTLYRPHSLAMVRVMPLTPALAAP